jgi:hypothetical protein
MVPFILSGVSFMGEELSCKLCMVLTCMHVCELSVYYAAHCRALKACALVQAA